MVAVVVGNGLGLLNTSGPVLGGASFLGGGKTGGYGDSLFVNARNGNLVLQRNDDFVASAGNGGIALARTYNSQGQLTDDNGDNWQLGLSKRLLFSAAGGAPADSTITRVDGDGTTITYHGSGTVPYTSYFSKEGAGAHDTIVWNDSTRQWTWTEGSTHAYEIYDETGRLVQSGSGNGVAALDLTYHYDANGLLTSVVDASGAGTFFTYDTATGRNLASVDVKYVAPLVGQPGTQLLSLKRVRYLYDDQNRLKEVQTDLTPADGAVSDGKMYWTRYTYEGTSRRISTVTQIDGSKLVVTYDTAGRVDTITDGMFEKQTFKYTSESLTRVTDQNGVITVFDHAGGVLHSVTSDRPTAPDEVGNYDYDEDGNVTLRRDAEGGWVSMRYDTNGNCIYERNAAGNVVERVYGTDNRLRVETRYASSTLVNNELVLSEPLVSRFAYDATGNLRFEIDATGALTEYRYNALRQRTDTIAYTNLRVTLPDGPVTVEQVAPLAYAERANVMRTAFTYDVRGALATSTTFAKINAADGEGVLDGFQSVINYTFDQAGQLVQTIDGNKKTTSYVFDGLGRVLSQTDTFNGATTSTSTTFNDLALPRNGKQTTIATTVFRDGHRMAQIFDGNGRLLETQMCDGAGYLMTDTLYGYDSAGRMNMVQDAGGGKSYTLYDDMGRKGIEVDADGSATEYKYDLNGQLLRTIRRATPVNVTSFATTAKPLAALRASDIVTVANAADRSEWRSYDAAGRLLRVVDNAGYVTDNSYDGAGRLVQTRAWATAIAPGVLDKVSMANPPESADDRIDTYQYDGEGNLLEKHVGGLRTTYTRDAIGHVTSTDIEGSTAKQYAYYDARGLLAGEIDGERYLTTYKYDANGNVTEKRRYSAAVTWAADKTLAMLIPTGPAVQTQVWTYGYTLDRLTLEVEPDGRTTDYVYDKVGSLISTTVRETGVSERSVIRRDMLGRVIGELRPEGAVFLVNNISAAQIDAIYKKYGIVYTYDSGGRRTSMQQGTSKTVYYYDDEGRLSASINSDGEVEYRTYTVFNELEEVTRFTTQIAAVASYTGGKITSAIRKAIQDNGKSQQDIVTHYDYNGLGQVKTVRDTAGVRTMDYDAFGQVSAMIDDGTSSTLRYDHSGRVVSRLVNGGASPAMLESFIYDDAGRKTFHSVGGVGTWTYYDNLGRAVKTQSALTPATETRYDAFSRVTATIDSAGKTTTYTYDADLRTRKTTVTSAEGVVTQLIKNHNGQLKSVTTGNESIYKVYNRDGEISSSSDTVGSTGSTGFDNYGMVLFVTDSSGIQTYFTYDAAGRVRTATQDPTGLNLVTTYEYDGAGQLTKVTDPAGMVTTTEYDNQGRVRVITADAGRLNLQTKIDYNALGQAERTTSPNGTVTFYTFDAFGRHLSETVDEGGLALTTTFAYDSAGNVIARTDPEHHQTRFFYDANNRLSYQIDAAGDVTRFGYDADNRLIETTKFAVPVDAGAIAVNLDPSAADAVATLLKPDSTRDAMFHNVYDGDGRLRFTISGTGTVSERRYNAQNRADVSITYAASLPVVAGYAYATVVAAVAQIANAAQDQKTVTQYDGRGRVISDTNAAGGVTRYTYDASDRMIQADRLNSATGTLVSRQRMVYDHAGRLLGSATVEQFDAAGVPQLWSVQRQSVDRAGNVIERTRFANLIGPELIVNQALGTTTVASVASVGWLDSVVADPARDESSRFVYDTANRQVASAVAQHRDADGVLQWSVTEREYDKSGNLVLVNAHGNFLSSDGLDAHPSADAVRQWIDAQPTDTGRDSITRMAYDGANRMRYSVDAVGAVVRTDYDGVGNVLKTVAFANKLAVTAQQMRVADFDALATTLEAGSGAHVSTAGYDALGHAVQIDDGSTAVQLRSYDAFGNLTGTQTDDRVQRFVYDADGRLRYAVDSMGHITETEYNGAGQVLRTVEHYITAAPDAVLGSEAQAGLLVNDADTRNRITSYTYDAMGHVASVTDPMGYTESFKYDNLGRKTEFTNKKGDKWTYKYDSHDRLTAETSPPVVIAGYAGLISLVTAIGYDSLGNVASRTEAKGLAGAERTTTYGYDLSGRQIRTTLPAVAVYNAARDPLAAIGVDRFDDMPATGPSNLVAYDALGNAVSNTDALGNVTRKVYDQKGQVRYDIDALGFATVYQRDAFGNVLSLTRLAQPVLAPADQLGVAALYQALLGRASDAGANDYWGAELRAGDNLATVAERILQAPEALAHYPADATAAAFVATLFDQTLGRAPSATELARYSAMLGQPGASRGAVVAAMLDGIGTDADLATFSARIGTLYPGVRGLRESLVDARRDIVAGAADRTIFKTYDSGNRVLTSLEGEGSYHQALGTASGAELALYQGRRLTSSRYDEHGQLIETRVAVTGTSDTLKEISPAAVTRYAYNARGDKVAELALADTHANLAANKGTGPSVVQDIGAYLTKYEYDAAGNLAVTHEYGDLIDFGDEFWASNWTDNNSANWLERDEVRFAGMRSAARDTRIDYDNNGQKIAETQEDVDLGHGVPRPDFPEQTDHARARINVTTQYTYDKVGNLTGTLDALGGVTYSYYDAIGRVTGVTHRAGFDASTVDKLEPGSAGEVPLSLTEFQRDAYGNVVRSVAYAHGASEQGVALAPDALRDRVTQTTYDLNGKATQIIDAAGNVSYASYDKLGRLAKQWQNITQLQTNYQRGRNDATVFQIYRYDANGQTVQTIAPGTSSIVFGQGDVQVTDFVEAPSKKVNIEYGRDGVEEVWDVEYNGVNSVSLTYPAMPDAAEVKVDLVYLDHNSATPITRSVTGGVLNATVSWTDDHVIDGGILRLVGATVSYRDNDGAWHVAIQANEAQMNATPHGVELQPGVVNMKHQSTLYNAFGEVVERSQDGVRTERNEYDNAGNLWRSKGADGVAKVFYYGTDGKATMMLRSEAGDLMSYAKLADIDVHGTAFAAFEKTETLYDLLGHIAVNRTPGMDAPPAPVTVSDPDALPHFSIPGIRSMISLERTTGSAPAWQGMNRVRVVVPQDPRYMDKIKFELVYHAEAGGPPHTVVKEVNGSDMVELGLGLWYVDLEWKDGPPFGVEADSIRTFTGGVDDRWRVSGEVFGAPFDADYPSDNWADDTSHGEPKLTIRGDVTLQIRRVGTDQWQDLAVEFGGNHTVVFNSFYEEGIYEFAATRVADGQVSTGRFEVAVVAPNWKYTLLDVTAYHATESTPAPALNVVAHTAGTPAIVALERMTWSEGSGSPDDADYVAPTWVGRNRLRVPLARVGTVPEFFVGVEYTFPGEDGRRSFTRPIETSLDDIELSEDGWYVGTVSWDSDAIGGPGVLSKINVLSAMGNGTEEINAFLNPVLDAAPSGGPFIDARGAVKLAYRLVGSSNFTSIDTCTFSHGFASFDMNALAAGEYEFITYDKTGASAHTGKFKVAQGTDAPGSKVITIEGGQTAPRTTASAPNTATAALGGQISPMIAIQHDVEAEILAPFKFYSLERTSWTEGSGSPDDPGYVYPAWTGTNKLTVPLVGVWRGREFEVELYYKSVQNDPPFDDEPAPATWTVKPTVTGVASAPDGRQFASIEWSDAPPYGSQLLGMHVRAKDFDGNWVDVGTELKPVFNDERGTYPQLIVHEMGFLQYRPVGSGAFASMVPNYAGPGYTRYDLDAVPPGEYEYVVKLESGETFSKGTFTITAPTEELQRKAITIVEDFSNDPLPDPEPEPEPQPQPVAVSGGIFQRNDRWGNVIEVTDARNPNWSTRYTYNDFNRQTKVETVRATVASGTRSEVLTTVGNAYYDVLGRQVAMRDAMGNESYQTYERHGQVGTQTDAEGGLQYSSYNQFGERIRLTQKVTGGADMVTDYSYDLLGHVVTSSVANVKTYALDNTWAGNGMNVVGEGSLQTLTTRYEYDQLGRRIAIFDSANGESRTRYDLDGNVVATSDQTSIGLTYYFDNFHHKIMEVDGVGKTLSWQYDDEGKLFRYTDMSNAVVHYGYDGLGRKTSQTSSARGTDGLRQNILYSYDKAGLLARIEDLTSHQVTTYEYDLAGNRVHEKTVILQTKPGAVAVEGFPTDSEAVDITELYEVLLGVHPDLQGLKDWIARNRSLPGYATRTDMSAIAEIMLTSDAARETFKSNGSVAEFVDKLFAVAVGRKPTASVRESYITRFDNGYDRRGRVVAQFLSDLLPAERALLNAKVYEALHSVNREAQQVEEVVQDNRIEFDDLGRMHIVEDMHSRVEFVYDANGNRLEVKGAYRTAASGYIGVEGAPVESDVYNTYDKANRQLFVNAVKVDGELQIGKYGHKLTYDSAGNRRSDTYRRKPEDAATVVTDNYGYDNAGRMTTTMREGWVIDLRQYDIGGRVIRSGITFLGADPDGERERLGWDPVFDLFSTSGREKYKGRLEDWGIATNYRTFNYDAAGRILRHKERDFDGKQLDDIKYVSDGMRSTPMGYDNAGRLRGYFLVPAHADLAEQYNYSITYSFQDSAQQSTLSVMRDGKIRTTTSSYDQNGNLIRVSSPRMDTEIEIDRVYINDATGHILRMTAGSEVTNSLVVNDQLLASFGGMGGDLVDGIFANTFRSATDVLASGVAPSVYVVQNETETLETIAKMIWGDSSLWYLIADANGMAGEPLTVGMPLQIPTRVSSVRNDYTSFKPYDRSSIDGSLTPSLPAPEGKGGCGPVGTIVTIVVAAILNCFAPGLGVMLIAAISSAVGQYAAIAAGEQKSFSWKAVAMAAISAGVAEAVGTIEFTGNTVADKALSSAVANAVTQKIGVELHLQEKFSWRGVAAAGASTWANETITNELQNSDFAKTFGNPGVKAVANFGGGVASAIARGGKIRFGGALADAFGNALGSSLTKSPQPIPQSFDMPDMPSSDSPILVASLGKGANDEFGYSELTASTGMDQYAQKWADYSDSGSVPDYISLDGLKELSGAAGANGGVLPQTLREHVHGAAEVAEVLHGDVESGIATVSVVGSKSGAANPEPEEVPRPAKPGGMNDAALRAALQAGEKAILEWEAKEAAKARKRLDPEIAAFEKTFKKYAPGTVPITVRTDDGYTIRAGKPPRALGPDTVPALGKNDKVAVSRKGGKAKASDDPRVNAGLTSTLVPMQKLTARQVYKLRQSGTPIPGSKLTKTDAIEDAVGFDRKLFYAVGPNEISANLDRLQPTVKRYARENKVDPNLINAVITLESKGMQNAVSGTGALGAAQLTSWIYGESKALGPGINPFDPAQAIERQALYLSKLSEAYDNNLDKTVAAYNQGQKAVNKAIKNYGDDWRSHIAPEGFNYVDHIKNIMSGNRQIPGYFGTKR